MLAGRRECRGGGRFEEQRGVALGDERDARLREGHVTRSAVLSPVHGDVWRRWSRRAGPRTADDLTTDDRHRILIPARRGRRAVPDGERLFTSLTCVGTSDAHNVSATGLPTSPDSVCAIRAEDRSSWDRHGGA